MQAVIKRKTDFGYLVGVINNKGSVTMVFSFSTQIAKGMLEIMCTVQSLHLKIDFAIIERI